MDKSLQSNLHEEVQIISAQDFAARHLIVPTSFQLCFPSRWKPRPLQNRYAAAIERETIAWLRSFGIGCTREEEEKLRKFNCAMYGGYSLPMADYATGLLVTEYISLWLFWDDVQVEEELKWDIEEVVHALTVPARMDGASRYVAAWADIGRRLQKTQSQRWLNRLATTMRQWLENAKLETRIARSYKKGTCPEVSPLFECRTISIGMFPTFHLIEYCEGFELPDCVHIHETIVALKRLASRLVGMGNDLGGLAKDISNRWLNLVLVMSEQSSLTIEEAFQRVVDLHNADVAEFDQLASKLPSFGQETDALLYGWVEAIRYNVHGFALWESTAARYQEYKAIVGNTALVAPVTSSTAGPARLVSFETGAGRSGSDRAIALPVSENSEARGPLPG